MCHPHQTSTIQEYKISIWNTIYKCSHRILLEAMCFTSSKKAKASNYRVLIKTQYHVLHLFWLIRKVIMAISYIIRISRPSTKWIWGVLKPNIKVTESRSSCFIRIHIMSIEKSYKDRGTPPVEAKALPSHKLCRNQTWSRGMARQIITIKD